MMLAKLYEKPLAGSTKLATQYGLRFQLLSCPSVLLKPDKSAGQG